MLIWMLVRLDVVDFIALIQIDVIDLPGLGNVPTLSEVDVKELIFVSEDIAVAWSRS